MLRALWTLVRWIFTPFIALLLVFEEWGWEPLSALMARLARLPLWSWMERRIAKLPPWGALLMFALPSLALLPIKLLALYFISRGQAGVGVGILIAAKIVGTAILARLFHITQPALMQLAWFAKWYPRWKTWKDALMDNIRANAVWQAARRMKAVLRRLLRRMIRNSNNQR
jgi:hypothetical protein